MTGSALLICCFASAVLLAQAPTGAISGTATDLTGAVIPGARITITTKTTGIARVTTTNSQGLYSAPALAPGDYDVLIEMKGLRTTVRPANVLAGNTTVVDFSLPLGETKEAIVVEAATAQISYDSNTVQGIIGRLSIQDLPLNGRSSLQLASLEPGVTVSPGSTAQFNAMFTVSILGANGGASSYSGVGPLITMDGGTINDLGRRGDEWT